jgi:cytochrome c
MKTLSVLAVAASLAFSGAAVASPELAKKDGCVACHDATAKRIGPSWTEIAAKYRGDKNAEMKLVESIAKGSKGVFGGKMPMPPQPRAAADAHALVKWILSH